jgi:amidohydrolase
MPVESGPRADSVSFDEKDATTYLEALRPYADEARYELIDVSHQIHERPEIRFQETFASQLLTAKLEKHGFAVQRGIADLPTAFVGTASNANRSEDSPTIAVFCEYDALEGLGHACGHNIIASAGLGAAIIIKRWLEDHPETPGRLVVLGSPGEEGGGGKVYLIEGGYLEGVDAALMVHPGGEDRAARKGFARVALQVEFTGKPAHAAAQPHEGINALDAANLTLVAIGLLRQQVRPDSRIHAIIVDGGQAPNIIPERAALRMYVRSLENAYLEERLLPAVENCIRGAALATGAEAKIEQPAPAYKDMISNAVLIRLSEANLRALGREVNPDLADGGMGSTDMGNVSHVVPSIHPHMKLLPGLTMHTHEAADAAASSEGDEAVVEGALELAMTAVELYSQPELLSAVRTDFEQRR